MMRHWRILCPVFLLHWELLKRRSFALNLLLGKKFAEDTHSIHIETLTDMNTLTSVWRYQKSDRDRFRDIFSVPNFLRDGSGTFFGTSHSDSHAHTIVNFLIVWYVSDPVEKLMMVWQTKRPESLEPFLGSGRGNGFVELIFVGLRAKLSSSSFTSLLKSQNALSSNFLASSVTALFFNISDILMCICLI